MSSKEKWITASTGGWWQRARVERDLLKKTLPSQEGVQMQGPQAQWCQHHGWCRHDTTQCWGAVGKGGKGLGSPTPFPRTRSEQGCMYCGSKEHSRYQCPKAKDSGYTCFNCSQVGHQVKDCLQAFNETLVDQNVRVFLQAITNGAQFVPVQLNVVTKSTKSFKVIGKETWKTMQCV